MLKAHAADQREPRRDLETILQRYGGRIEPLVDDIGFENTETSANRIDDIDGILRKAAGELRERDLVAARLELRCEPVVHAVYVGVPEQIGVIADDMLVMSHKEAVTVDGRVRGGVEGVSL